MIKKIRLKNWRSHADSELTFSNGTNALVGILGSGKTSVLDAMCFAFFGTYPALQMRKLKLDDVIMKKPQMKDRAEVEIEFEIDGESYAAKRIVERGNGTTYSEIRQGGKVLESSSAQRVTETIEKILKVSYELFSKAIYAEQNNIDYFLTLGKGQRMKKIDELLMIDKFEKARSSSVTLANRLADRMVGKQSVIANVDADKIKQSLEEIKNDVQKSANVKKELEVELDDAKNRKVELEKEVLELRKINDDLQLLKRQESGIDSAIEETERIVAELREAARSVDSAQLQQKLAELSNRVGELNESLDRKQKEYEATRSSIVESKSKIEFLRKEKIGRLEKEIEGKLKLKEELDRLQAMAGGDVEIQLKEKNELYNGIINELAEAKARISGLQEVLETLSSIHGKCPVCDSEISDERRSELVEGKSKELHALNERINEAARSRQLTESQIEKLKAIERKMNDFLVEVKGFDEMKSDLESSRQIASQHIESAALLDKQLAEMKSGIEEMKKELDGAANEKQQLQSLEARMKDYSEREKRVAELEEKRQLLKQELKLHEEKMRGRELEKLEAFLKNVSVKEREIEMRIGNIEESSKEKVKRFVEYEAVMLQVEKDKDEVARLGMLVKEMKIFTEALKQTQVQLRENFVSAVNMRMGEIWQTLYPYRDFVGVRLAVEEGDYVLQMQEQSGNWVNVEGVASGGERSIACLALRIAFALVLAPQLPMLVLDEPTANLDRQAVSVLANTLRDSIKDFMEQCFLVTHDEALEEAVTGNAYRIERDKGKDGESRIVPLN